MGKDETSSSAVISRVLCLTFLRFLRTIQNAKRKKETVLYCTSLPGLRRSSTHSLVGERKETKNEKSPDTSTFTQGRSHDTSRP